MIISRLFRALSLFVVLLFGTQTLAQTSIEFIGSGSGTSSTGPTTNSPVITFYQNATTPSAPPVTATFTYSNQQFATTEGNPSVPGMSFGTNSQAGVSAPFNIAVANPVYDLMNVISAPSNANFTACNACATGTGVDIAVNRAVALYSSTDALINSAGANLYPVNARVYMGDLTITFSQPVNNPVMHVVGLGGTFTYSTGGGSGTVNYDIGFTSELDLITAGLSLIKRSGNAALTVSSTSVQNTAAQYGSATASAVQNGVTRTAASGTVTVQGRGITAIKFKVYLKGDGGTIRNASGAVTTATDGNILKWSDQLNFAPGGTTGTLNAFSGDKYMIGLSLQPCQQILNPSAAQTVCQNAAGANITVLTDKNTANSVRFVRFASDQIAGADPTLAEATSIYGGTPIANVTPTGASSLYTATYVWNSADFSTPGTYYVYAILGEGLVGDCYPVQEIVVNILPLPSPAIAGTLATCNSLAQTLTASGGASYKWSSGETTAAITKTPGTYTVTATASNGCTNTKSATIANVQGTIGNYVWHDLNKNGLQDEAATAGINGLSVQLYKENAPGSGTYTLLQTTSTANNGGGNPGYYSFTVCATANYYIKFPMSSSGRSLTAQTATAATDNNSDASTTNGQSPVFAININGSGTARDNPTIDAGYKCDPECGTVLYNKN